MAESMEERPSPSLGLNRQHADFVASFTADLKSDFFIENSGDALRRISKAGRDATRMTDRWEVCRPHLSWTQGDLITSAAYFSLTSSR